MECMFFDDYLTFFLQFILHTFSTNIKLNSITLQTF